MDDPRLLTCHSFFVASGFKLNFILFPTICHRTKSAAAVVPKYNYLHFHFTPIIALSERGHAWEQNMVTAATGIQPSLVCRGTTEAKAQKCKKKQKAV